MPSENIGANQIDLTLYDLLIRVHNVINSNEKTTNIDICYIYYIFNMENNFYDIYPLST